jgi:uncharacterized membrane protein
MRFQAGPLFLHDGVAGGWPMLVLMAILTAAVVVAVVFLVRYLIRTTPPARTASVVGPTTPTGSVTEDAGAQASVPLPGPGSPQDVLKRRYAAGEIEREEYLQKLQDL